MEKSTKYSIGNLIGNRYRVFDLINTGGFSQIYLCHDLYKEVRGHPVSVALKTSKHNVLDHTEISEVENELYNWLSLDNHPNILKCYGLFIDKNQWFIILSLSIEGKFKAIDLRNELNNKGSLGIIKSLEYSIDVCSALAHAHSKKVLHGDLKPSNLIISQGYIQVADWGLSRLITDSITKSSGGTPRYLAPESWMGNIGPKSDIYSFGCLLYEMLSGTPLFPMNSIDELKRAHLEFPTDNLVKQLKRVPKPLKHIIEKCTAKSERKRFKDFNAILKKLWSLYRKIYPNGPETIRHAVYPDFYVQESRTDAEKIYKSDLINPFKMKGIPRNRFFSLAGMDLHLKLNTQDYVDRARMEFQQENFSKALHYYEDALNISPNAGEILLQKSITQLKLGFKEKGLNTITNLIGNHAEADRNHFMENICFLLIFEDLNQENLKLINLFKKEEVPIFKMLIGISYYELSEYKRAVLELKTAFQMGERSKELLPILGISLSNIGEFEESIIFFLKALEIEKSSENYLNLSNSYYNSGKIKKAFQAWEKADRIKNGNDENIGTLLFAISEKVYEKLCSLSNEDEVECFAFDNQEFHHPDLVYAIILLGLQRPFQGLFDWLLPKYIRIIDNFVAPTVFIYCTELLFSNGAYKHGLHFARCAQSEVNFGLDHYFELVRILRKYQFFQESIKLLSKGIDKHPQNGLLFSIRGLIHHENFDNFQSAEQDHVLGIEKAPDNPTVHYNHGCFLANTGKIHEAIKSFRKSGDLGYDAGRKAEAYLRNLLFPNGNI